jgi:hypothetical protein
LSVVIAEKVRLKSEAEICGTALVLLEPVLGEVDDELLHAPTTTTAVAAIEAQASFLVKCKETTRFVPWPGLCGHS